MIETACEHQFIQTNGIQLHVTLAGPADGQPVVMLHGFPEFWYGWHNQIDFLAARGFRLIIPDQRGYNLSDKPRGVSAYRIDTLAQDIVGLIDALGYETVYLAGHDWGAAVSWWLVTHYPDRLRKLAILNVPYPTLMGQAYRQGNVRQMMRSWYIAFFQLPWLPETMLRLSAGTSRNLLAASSRRSTFSAEDMAAYRQAWAQPGALTSMVNWYRAASKLFFKAETPAPGSIQTPTLMLWGERDIALGKELAQPSIDLCATGELHFFPQATHWVQHDAAADVNAHLARFFSS